MRRTARIRLRRIAVVGLVCFCIWFTLRYRSLYNLSSPQHDETDSAEHFARTLKVSVRVVRNVQPFGAHHVREVTLSNPGSVEFSAKGWEIYFTQIYIPYLGRPDGASIDLRHVQGQLYKFSPLKDFQPIPAGGEITFRYQSNGHSVVYTDFFPNWYIIYKGSQPLVLECTQGDPAKFTKIHNTEEAWKADSNPQSGTFDHHNPPTSGDRFVRDSSQDLSHDPLPVIPTPLEISSFNKEVSINMHAGPWVIIGESSFHTEMEFLAKAWQLKISASRPASYYIKFSRGNILLSKSVANRSKEEAYSIEVSPSTNIIQVSAYKHAGAFRAVQSLIALRDEEGKLPSITFSDAPRFAYRGVMIDIARNFHSKETIKRLIRLMALYKLNKLHLHLSDDEGWRIEIPGLEELTTIGSQRCHDLREKRCLLPFLGSGPDTHTSGTGYLSVSDYKEILKYAVEHHIEVIPEVDVPGHAHAAVVAMKQRYINTGSDKYILSESKDGSYYKSIQGYTDNVINPCLNSTYVFLRKVITELYNMHKGISPLTRFHFGGDEVPESAWMNSPACRYLSGKGLGFSMTFYFIERLTEITDSLGIDIAAWEDGFKEGGRSTLPLQNSPQKKVYAYSWKNPPHMNMLKSAYTMANSGYQVVLASATNLYLDHPQEPDPAERGLVWATRFVSAKRSFSYSPMNLYSSTDVDIRGRPYTECFDNRFQCTDLKKPENVEGMEAILFGELTTSQEILDFMLLPRLLAVAERAWHEADWEKLNVGMERKKLLNEDWTKFTNTLGYRELPRLDRLGYQYRIPPPGAILDHTKGLMLVNVTYPSQMVEISRNGGWGWALMQESSTKVIPGEKILLRTRVGSRTSRAVQFDPKRLLVLDD